jgi:LacI family transcriptional regulator
VHRATLRDVAARAGVHTATASRALNESTRKVVNPATAERVRVAARDLGYTANPIARSLKTSRSSTIGVIIPDLTNPLFPPIVRGIEDALRTARYSAWIANTDNSSEREAEALDSFQQRSVEGFVFATARLDHPLLEELAKSGTPMVLVNRGVAGADIPTVSGDDVSGIALAMEHLRALGHRQIVHLAGPQDLSTGLNRRRAFRQSLDDLRLPAEPNRTTVCKSWSATSGAEALESIIAADVPFTAVLAGNDLIALGAYECLAAHGLRCPSDVSVVGFNDMPLIDKVHPPMTSVRIPTYELGAEAARLLLERIEDPNRHLHSILLPPSLTIRGSTGPVRRS